MSVNVYQLVTGTSTAYRSMTIPNYFFWRHIYRFTNLLLFVSQKKDLDSIVLLDDNNLVNSGYNLIRSDHPFNTKRGGVCLYYKNHLPISVLNVSYLKNVWTSSIKLPINLVTLLPFKGPQVSLKTILKPSLITLKWG